MWSGGLTPIETSEKLLVMAIGLPQKDEDPEMVSFWFPRSPVPENAYRIYSEPPTQFLKEADRLLLSDIVLLDLPSDLSEEAFRFEICNILEEIPLAKAMLDAKFDINLTHADAFPILRLLATEEISTNDLWRAFVNWMVFFFPNQVMRQEITEIALRRAQVIG